MPVIRFVREGRDVECYPGENLREVALREGIQLYGLKGQLGNCGGCGQCITCFVKIEGDSSEQALSRRTAVEGVKLKRRPEGWRLARWQISRGVSRLLCRRHCPWGLSNGRVQSALMTRMLLPRATVMWRVLSKPGWIQKKRPRLLRPVTSADRFASKLSGR